MYQFYTMESPPHFNFNKHDNSIHHIQWLEDDTGFVSCGTDKKFNFWNLYKKDGKNKEMAPEPKWNYDNNKVMFTSTYVYKTETGEHVVYATCSDKSIREIGAPDEKQSTTNKGKERIKYEECISYAQVIVGQQRKMIVAGVSESDRPGSIQFFRYPFDKAVEVQAHAAGVNEMRLSIDSKNLFSIGKDGSIYVFNVEDKELKRTFNKDFSEEILIEKQRQDELAQQIKALQESIELEKRNHKMQLDNQHAENDAKIEELKL